MGNRTRSKTTVADGIVAAASDANAPARAVIYEPGNGTRYALIFTQLDGIAAGVGQVGLSFGTTCGWGPSPTLVTLWPGDTKSAAMLVADLPGEVIHWRYVAEKLRLGQIDAVAVAEIIGETLGRPYVSAAEFADHSSGAGVPR